VDGASHLDLPLNLDDPLLPHEHVGRDPDGVSEGVVDQVEHGQAVDLPQPFTLHIDPDRPLLVGPADPFLHQVGAEVLLLDGPPDVGAIHLGRPLHPGPGGGLHQDLRQLVELGGHPLLMVRQAGGPLDHLGHALGGIGKASLLLNEGGDETGEQLLRLSVAGHILVEVRLDLEDLRELRIVDVQQVIEPPGPDHDHLHPDRDRLRAQGGDGHEAQLLAQVLDGQLFRPKDPLEGVPGHELTEQLLRLQDEEPPVGLVDGTGHDAPEIRVEIALPTLVLHLAHQVVVGRIRLPDHRSPLLGIVGDEDVHGVAGKIHLRVLIPGRGQEDVEVLDDVLRQIVEPRAQLALHAELIPDLVQQRLDRVAADLRLQGLDLLLQRLLPIPNLAERLQRPLGDLLGGFLKGLLLLLTQLLELLLLHLPDRLGALLVGLVDHGEIDEPLRGPLDGEALLQRPGPQLLHELVDLLLELLDEEGFVVLVLAIVEGLAQGDLEILDEILQLRGQLLALARGKADRQGFARIVEIVGVDPVVRGGHLLRPIPQLLQGIGRPPASRVADDEEVVPLAVDGQTEGDRADRPFLADQPLETPQFVGRSEAEPRRIGPAAQGRVNKAFRFDQGHPFPSLRMDP